MLALDLCRSGADDAKILQWLDEMTPALRAESLDQLHELRRGMSSRDMDDDAVTVAGLCVGGDPDETFHLVRWQRPPDERAELVPVLIGRRSRAWRDAYARLAAAQGSWSSWWLLRHLVREGLAERPADGYVEQMVGGVAGRPWSPDAGSRIAEALRADPGLLETELWELLALEGVTRRLSEAWVSALAEIAGDGHRDRLLDAAFHALVTDWRPVDQKPFLDLLQLMEPTPAELERRLPGVLRMTASDNGPVVQWALAQLRTLHDAGLVEADDVLAVRAPLQRRDKRSAFAHLGLLEQVAKHHPARHGEVVASASVALDHERRDVRERAQRLVDRLSPDRGSGSASSGRLDAAAPVVVAAASSAVPEQRPQPAAFTPIRSADEMVELLLALLAGQGTALDCERSFDAAVRLRHEVGDAGRKALRQALERLTWNSSVAVGAATLAHELAQPRPRDQEWRPVVYDTDPHETEPEKRNLTAMVDLRVQHVVQAMRSSATRLLSTPTTVDGALSVVDLEERLRSTRDEPAFRADVGSAAFRIDPSEYGDLDRLRFSPVGTSIAEDVVRISQRRPTWQAVPYQHERQSWMSDRQASLGAGVVWEDATPEAEPAREFVGTLLDRRDVARRGLRDMAGSHDSASESSRGLWPLMLPHHRELLAAHAHPVVAWAVTSKYTQCVSLVLGLGGGTSVVGPVACSAVGVGLTALEPAPRAAAVDAVIELATFGLLDGAELGRQLTRVLEGPGVTGSRIADGLREAGRALGPLAGGVLDAHVELLPVLRARRDGFAFAEMTADLALSLGRRVALPPELLELAAGRSGSALARAVRRIPQAGVQP